MTINWTFTEETANFIQTIKYYFLKFANLSFWHLKVFIDIVKLVKILFRNSIVNSLMTHD